MRREDERMRYVIIGNSAAGIGAVEGIRQVDKKGEITIISSESHHTYSRPLISYFLQGKVTKEKMNYRGTDFYTDHCCTLLTDTIVKKIDPTTKQVLLSDEKTIPYDKLLVATGSNAFVPPFEGVESVENRFTFMSLKDAEKLDRALPKTLPHEKPAQKRVLIIGAGLIGLKCAEGISDRTSHITVIDLAPRILSSILDEKGASQVKEHLEKKNISFMLSCGVQAFEKNTAILDNGKKIDFDILVLAVGVRANTSLLKDIADIERGIVINAKSETTAPDIYAAGDCTQTLDISSGENKIMALLPNAYMQGECAGINMAGGNKSFEKAIPMNAIGFFGLHIITAGSYNGDEYCKSDSGSYKRLFYKDNKLVGIIVIGNVEKAGIYTGLIREQTPLDTIDFELICEKPGLMAFTKEYRAIKLGSLPE